MKLSAAAHRSFPDRAHQADPYGDADEREGDALRDGEEIHVPHARAERRRADGDRAEEHAGREHDVWIVTIEEGAEGTAKAPPATPQRPR